ncbi:hypothetical protein [Siansivirga zeaxanthinifaciens]|uniref:Uncharacterized protein n=1 Tax=Siansivirga zeaxanthinifaciens CC-SAMT-1 TaxID=1454006 RepID=A0A0C5WPY2_9FLAO|nr:hypothetical protein [Siansivirga zeaxanthinifaciens]AJR05005.1 hypothetical protein AW14_14460 [Siansivirga zeaxanthinifaciens CC-SAMT-1]
MDTIRMVSFSTKNLKRELIISSKQLESFQLFLKDLIKNKLLIINTNLGVEIYYYAPVSCEYLIQDVFFLIACNSKYERKDFIVKSLNSEAELKVEINALFIRLCRNPLLFKSYLKSITNQINNNYHKNPEIIDALFKLWKKQFLKLKDIKGMHKLMPLLIRFQDESLEKNYNPVLQSLLKQAVSLNRVN